MSVSVAKNTFYLTVATIGQKVLAFLYFLFIANVMRPEQTGAYFLALSITTIFSVVADFGISPVVIREVAKKSDEAVPLVRRALGLKLPLVIFAMAGSVIAARLLNYSTEVQLLVALATLVMAEDSISLLYFGVLRGLQVLRFESLGMMFGEVLIVLVGGLSLIFHPSLFLLILALVVGSAFNAIFSSLQVVKQLGWSVIVPKFEFFKIKKLLQISFPFALAGFFSKLFSYIDTVVLSVVIGTTAVGVYAIAYKMTYAFQFLPLAFVAALYPGMSSLVVSDKEKLAKLFERAMWYLLILVSPIAFGIFAVAPDVVRLAGVDYAEAVPVLRILIFVLVPLFLDFPIGSLLNAADRQTTKTAIMGSTMIINAVANFLLIPIVGIMGAAYAASISFWFMFLAGLYFTPKIIPTLPWRHFAWLFVKIIGSGAVMAGFTLWLRPAVGFFAIIPMAAAVYIILLFLTKSVKLEQLKDLRKLILPKKYEESPPINSGFST